jgi:hypothetical protein
MHNSALPRLGAGTLAGVTAWRLLVAAFGFIGLYFVVERPPLYRGFLDPDSGDFSATVAGFLVAVLAAGYVLYGIAKARRA